jgi:hypothetical protein
LSSTDLGNLDAAMAAKLAKTGLPGISLIDTPSVNQVLKLAGTSLQLVGSVTLSDKSVSNVADALTVIAKGGVFSGASLVVKDAAALDELIDDGQDLDGKSIGVLKAKGVTILDLSGGTITEGDAQTLMDWWSGIKFVNAKLQTDTGSIDVELVAKFAALGILVPPTAVISSATNTVTFDQAYAITSGGGSIALKSGVGLDTALNHNHVVINAAGKTALSYTEAATILSKVPTAAFTGVNSIQLAAKNADFAAVNALAAKLQDAGINTIKLATSTSLSVSFAQLKTLAVEGVAFADGSDVRLQLTSGPLSAQFADFGKLPILPKVNPDEPDVTNTAGIKLIKAAGASLTLTSSDFGNLPDGMRFVAADMVTVQVSTLNPDDLDDYNTAGVDFVGAVGGKITITAAAAKAVVDASNVKLLPTDVVTVSLDSTAMASLPSQIAGYKAIGVDNFVVDAGVSVSYAAVQAVLTNQLSFTNNVTVNINIAAGNADELNYVIDNSGSLASAGVNEVNVDGNQVTLSMKQLSSLLAAGSGGIKFVDYIKVTVNTAADLAYFAASAKDIQVLQNVKELSLDPSIINIPLATAQLLAKVVLTMMPVTSTGNCPCT